MREGFLEELKAFVGYLEGREAVALMRERENKAEEHRLAIFKSELQSLSSTLEAQKKEAENLLKATANIRQELAQRKARIETLQHELAVREEKLAKVRKEKGELQSQVTALKKLISMTPQESEHAGA